MLCAFDFCVTGEIPKAPSILYSSAFAGECFGAGTEGRIPQLLDAQTASNLEKHSEKPLIWLDYPSLVWPNCTITNELKMNAVCVCVGANPVCVRERAALAANPLHISSVSRGETSTNNIILSPPLVETLVI